MTEERDLLIYATYSRWDGDYKYFTKDCKECPYYRIINGEDRCYWGIAWKRLVKREKLRKCPYIKLESSREKELKEKLKSGIPIIIENEVDSEIQKEKQKEYQKVQWIQTILDKYF